MKQKKRFEEETLFLNTFRINEIVNKTYLKYLCEAGTAKQLRK